MVGVADFNVDLNFFTLCMDSSAAQVKFPLCSFNYDIEIIQLFVILWNERYDQKVQISSDKSVIMLLRCDFRWASPSSSAKMSSIWSTSQGEMRSFLSGSVFAKMMSDVGKATNAYFWSTKHVRHQFRVITMLTLPYPYRIIVAQWTIERWIFVFKSNQSS